MCTFYKLAKLWIHELKEATLLILTHPLQSYSSHITYFQCLFNQILQDLCQLFESVDLVIKLVNWSGKRTRKWNIADNIPLLTHKMVRKFGQKNAILRNFIQSPNMKYSTYIRTFRGELKGHFKLHLAVIWGSEV